MNAQLKDSTMENVSMIRHVPLSETVLSELNVRKGPCEDGIAGLADSIFAEGVLQNLIGYEESIDGSDTTRKEVVAGGRRWRALQHLLRQGKIGPDYPVPIMIVSKCAAIVISLAENNDRLELSPADEFEAAQALRADGLSVEAIADRLRIDAGRVERRLRLAKVAPEFIDALRQKTMTLEHLKALATTDDQERQRTVWQSLSEWQREPDYIRRLLREEKLLASSALVRFVTLKAYEKAGGTTDRDLFSQDEELFVLDRGLLIDLAQSKLEKKAAQLKKEKPAWVHTHVGVLERGVLAPYVPVCVIERAMTEEETAQLAAYDDELAQLESALQDRETEGSAEYQEKSDRALEIEKARDALFDSLNEPVPEQAAKAGILVGLDEDGKIRIERRLLLADDAKLFAQQEQREPQTGLKTGRRHHSLSLLTRLTAERTLALRAAFVENPEVALAAIVHRFWRNTVGSIQCREDNALQIASAHRDLKLSEAAQAKSPAKALLDDRLKPWEALFDACPGKVFEGILTLSLGEKLELLALTVAPTLDAIQQNEGPSSADGLAKELGFDLRRWWTPTAENYFNFVPKDIILNAARECLPVEQTAPLELLKRAELAQRVGELLEGKGWIPEFLRSDRPASAQADELHDLSNDGSEDAVEETA